MLFALAAIFLLPLTLSLDSNGMRGRSVYQLVTDRFALPSNSTSSSCDPAARQYCGGTWAGVQSKLDYIQGMGFDTIWISPVVSNIGGNSGDGQSYHGYWSLDVSQLNSNFGTADDLRSLVSAIHSKGMYIMVDVVINHVAATSGPTFQTSSAYGAFSDQSDFHPFCSIDDYSNQTQVEQCWLGDESVNLPDLNTESDTVIQYWNNWITQLVSNYSIDAVRIDTVKHIRHSFWPAFTSAAGVFNQGEVLDSDPSYVGNYQSNGSINPFNYPVYYDLLQAFNASAQDLGGLTSMTSQVKGNFSDPTLAGSFLNNHDNPRFENLTTDMALIKNAHAYAVVGDGIPYVYYGSEAGFTGGNDPYNREALWSTGYNTSSGMYQYFTTLNTARKAAGNASSSFYTTQMNVSALSSNELLISKPPLISLLSNRGSSSSSTSNVTIPSSSSGWAASTNVIDVISCSTFTTDSSGQLAVGIQGGMPRVMIDSTKKGTLCGNVAVATPPKGKSSAGRIDVRRASVALAIGAAGLVSL